MVKLRVKEIIEALDIDVDKRLFQLKQGDLQRLLIELAKNKDKKFLAKLISDDSYFKLDDLIKALEKKDTSLLFKILNEPKKEEELHLPIANFLKKEWNFPHYHFEVNLPNTKRKIDVVGCEYSKYMGLSGEDRVVAVEAKISASRSAIDSAFSQAKDYIECSDFSYVAVSPYMFLKYPNVLLEKVKSYKKEIGLLLVDKMRVISVIRKAKETDCDEEKYNQILSYFKK